MGVDTDDTTTLTVFVIVIVLLHCEVSLSALLNRPKLVQVDICGSVVFVCVCVHARVCVHAHERERSIVKQTPHNRALHSLISISNGTS